VLITAADARAAHKGLKTKYCNKGIRLFFKKYDLDYRDFLKNGIDADILLALNDSMADRVVESKNGR
jgi:hypothetical protein